ncbi:MAG: adenosylmethionine--8-amino-7-oxononanoate transaminase [Aquificaceae bacterium]|nr:MAG: adenosylmethionine--8-amino-7-oxononanoate transaminase [Aquificaceae bacterium]
MTNDELRAYDQKHLWHPYTSMLNPSPVFPVASADGVYLTLETGQRLIDGMSSWWACIHGYNHPQLNQAIHAQVEKMSHVMFGGLTHRPAIDLAKKLIDLTADNLQHVFFADSGSVAVEVAIKMALQYWYAQGKTEKQKLLTVRNGYYGDTFGAMAVCDPVNGMHGMFRNILADNIFVEAPACEDGEAWRDEMIAEMAQALHTQHQNIAAVIIEPMVQNAGGMRFYCAEYLRQLSQLCKQFNVLLILDEIATGFGRTGSLFAYQQANIEPDILTIGKTLTGGYMTLAATLTSTKVAQGISADGSGVLMHGPTFMANPLACSVANASIDLLLASNWQEKVNHIEQQLTQELAPCTNLEVVKNVRCKGAIGVVELHHPIDINWMQPRFVELGVWIRPFGKLVYLMPPYIIEKAELSKLTQAIYQVVSEFSSSQTIT